MQVTGATSTQAKLFLAACKNNLEEAITSYYDGFVPTDQLVEFVKTTGYTKE